MWSSVQLYNGLADILILKNSTGLNEVTTKS